MHLLTAFNGTQAAHEAARCAARIATQTGGRLSIVAVAIRPGEVPALEAGIEALREEIARESAIPIEAEVRSGYPAEELIGACQRLQADTLVIGGRKRRRLRRPRLGSMYRRLIRFVNVPLLVAPTAPAAIRHMLICTAGESPGEFVARTAGSWACALGATVTALHVMSQYPLNPRAPLDDILADASELMERGSREGQHLARVHSIIKECGMEADSIKLSVRHGLVLDEILTEARSGSYDLLIVGAHSVPPSRRRPGLRRVIQDDFTMRLLNHLPLPVLVIQSQAKARESGE